MTQTTTQVIDFLPEEYRRRHRGRRVQAWSLIVAGAVGVLVAATSAAQYYHRRQAQQRLAAVLPHYEQCLTRQQSLEAIRKDIERERSEANLYAWLGNCWARSGLLAAATRGLPESIQFEQVQILDEGDRTAGSVASAKPADPKALAALKPAQRDLRRLREEAARTRTVLRITGTAADVAALHRYLGELGGSALFARAEVESFERIQGGKRDASRFRAVLLVRPEHEAALPAASGPPVVQPAGPPAVQPARQPQPDRVAAKTSRN